MNNNDIQQTDNNNIQQTTFWNFLKKNKIEIPIIQRDYAQGRIGKEKLREKFLIDLKKALDGDLQKGEKTLKLDFVYGSIDNDKFNPLDGQQRLTTLWLLHWYIAYKAKMLDNNNNKNVFKKFSYETRTSSKEFCEKLSDFELISEKPIVEQILNQTWFFSVWKQDPTIQAMLNMLGGTPITDSKENDILDGIEEVFKCDCDYAGYWSKLTGENCPIVFYFLDLEGLSLSDDLYIKMNARGKSLTHFENFKADLVGFIKEKGISKEEETPNKTISYKLDVDWTNLFWKYKSEDYKIDEIYFTFLNRYFFNSLITAKKKDKSDLYTQQEVESNKLFEYLYGKKSNDSGVKYNSFDLYTNEINVFDDKFFERLIITLDNFYKSFQDKSKEYINGLFMPSWDSNSNFHFIPEYIENPLREDDNSPKFISSTLTQSQRVVFFAICGYFEKNEYNENSFKHWMRIVWNIVENSKIDTIQSMIGAIRLIDNLVNDSHDIYERLKDRDVSKDFAKEQMEEEKEKAKQICNDKLSIWEKNIIDAEKTAFFKGTIRFLFKTNNNKYDWNKFDKRFKRTQKYFDENGVKSEYQENAKLICNLISHFTQWEQCWGDNKIKIGNGAEVWGYIIRNDNLLQPLVDMLDLDEIPSEIENFSSKIKKFEAGHEKMEKLAHEDMCNNGLIDEALETMGEGIVLNWRYSRFALYKPNAHEDRKKYVIGSLRNKIFFYLMQKEIISTDQNISEKLPYFYGWNLYFTLKGNGKKYQFGNFLKEQNGSVESEEISQTKLGELEKFEKKLKNDNPGIATTCMSELLDIFKLKY